MKNKRIYLLIITLGTLAHLQCTDLREDTYTFVTPEQFYRNAEDLDKALTGVYKNYQDHYGRDVYGYFLKIESLSEFGAPSRTKDNPHLYNVWSDVNNPSMTIDKWLDSYAIINAANVVLGRGEEIDMDETLQKRMFGEARFLRGLTYFHLLRLYGGVPIPETFTQKLEDLDIPRKTAEETYDYIIADLQYALENLPEKSAYSQDDVWRASKGAAAALLGKVFLYRGSMTGNAAYFEESKRYSGMVIQSGEYQLQPEFKDLWYWWNTGTKNGMESIFELQFGTAGGDNDNRLHIDAGINITDANLGSYMYHRFGPSFTAYNSFSDQDARKAATFLTSIRLTTGRTITWLPSDKGFYPGAQGWTTACPGNLKYYDRSSASAALGIAGSNFYVIRYAEVLLNYAEAANELNGPDGDAYDKVNQVRRRAKLADLPAGLTKQQFADALYRERGWELIGEGQLYYDGLRTDRIGDAVKAEVAYGVQQQLFLYTPLQFVPKKTFLWKIPVYDLNSNPALVQNPDNESK